MSVNEKIKPAPWTAWRSYITHSGEAKSIISNEKTHQKIFLEDESSILWSHIEKSISYADLLAVAEEHGTGDELDDFLKELKGHELLDVNDANIKFKRNAVPKPKLHEYAENTLPEMDFQSWVMSQGFMFSTHWELTYRCNERCVHCYNPGAAHSEKEVPKRTNKELTTNQVFTALDDFAVGGVFNLTLSGGEIMLRKDFFEIVEHARKLGMAVNIYTNAIKLDSAAISRLARLWPSTVSVSIYSNDEKTHDDITRVTGSYTKAVNALTELNNLGIRTSLKSVQMSHTLRAFSGILELSEEVGAIPESEIGLSPGVDGAIAPMLMSTQDPSELIVAAATPGFPIYVGNAENNYGEREKDKKATVCAAGFAGLNVSAEGNIYPCNSLPIYAGNLHHHKPLDVWNSATSNRKSASHDQLLNSHKVPALDEVTANLSKWQDVRLEDYEECGTHKRCSWCVKCPGMAFMETGRALAPSTTNCRIATARMFAATLLKSGESRDNIAERLNISVDYGKLEPGKREEVLEPEEGRSTNNDPRQKINIFKSDGSQVNLDKSRKVFITKKGEVWLRNGTQWNVDSLSRFDDIREKFPALDIVFD